MSTRLKLSPTVVINADEITQVSSSSGVNVQVYSTITTSYSGEKQGYLNIAAGGVGKGTNLAAAMNAALVGAPGGRVIEVPAGDYTVGAISYVSDF